MDREIRFPNDWKRNDSDRKRQMSLNFDLWKFEESGMFNLKRNKSQHDLPGDSGDHDAPGHASGQYNSITAAQGTAAAIAKYPTSHARTASNGSYRKEEENGTRSIAKFFTASAPSKTSYTRKESQYKDRPLENRYPARPAKPREQAKDATPSWKKKWNPIGIFVWGFAYNLKVKDLLDNFGCFGEITNGKFLSIALFL
jgi:hypothetical protein